MARDNYRVLGEHELIDYREASLGDLMMAGFTLTTRITMNSAVSGGDCLSFEGPSTNQTRYLNNSVFPLTSVSNLPQTAIDRF